MRYYDHYYSSTSSSSTSSDIDQNSDDVYSPDENVSGRTNHPGKQVVDPRTGRVIKVKRETPDDYLNVLKPVKGPKRMEFNPYLPKTLTPKGYAKVCLHYMLSGIEYSD
ncbi:unnamed protein product [Schistosoma curassoni]|uniref:Uncharacterized protein n=1 Tax=Schistosoma curassoni TaxID=6186 RepID=A0A183KSD1_9TREM|nr:unnamed protein product [Schistosoma curassoni]